MDTMKLIREFAQKLKNLEVSRREVWQETERVLTTLYKARLFTVLFHDERNGLLVRLYSSNEALNPVGGKKRVSRSLWSETVLRKGEVFIAPDKEALISVFPDAPVLISYGCESVLNLPVKFQGKVIGAINLMHEEHSYDRADLSPALVIIQMLVPYILDGGFESCRDEMPGIVTAIV
ncbi:TPA: GAF domain-containing protein [Klebsiella pneumoniae]|nr:GAF domain-containing protein [Klebsiella pneumoniae]